MRNMRRIKKLFCRYYQRWCKFSHQYVNGMKGAVSIFLALIMTPVFSLSLLLVESARYQNAVELLQELIDSAELSSLADYDNYVDERFGLLSLSNDSNISANIDKYLSTNIGSIGKSVTLNSVSAQGAYSLGDRGVLKQQVLEYSEISAVTELALDSIDLDVLMEQLKSKYSSVETMENYANEVSNMADAVSSTADAIAALRDLIREYNAYQTALNTYQTKAAEFEGKVQAIVNAIRTAEEKEKERQQEELVKKEEAAAAGETYETEDTLFNVYENADVKKAIRQAETARTGYGTANSNLETELGTLAGYVTTAINKASSAAKSTYFTKETADKIAENGKKTSGSSDSNSSSSSDTKADETAQSNGEWAVDVADMVTETFNKVFGDHYSDKVTTIKRNLAEQRIRLQSFDGNTITADTTAETISQTYGAVTIDLLQDSINFTGEMNSLILQINDVTQVSSDGQNMLSRYLDIMDSLIGLKGIYDGGLNARIDSSDLYDDSVAPEHYAEYATASMNDILDAGQAFLSAVRKDSGTIAGKIERIYNMAKAVVQAAKALAEFIEAVVGFIVDLIEQVINFVASAEESYNNALLAAYAAYNLPNRVTVRKMGKTLSGYMFSNVNSLAGGLKSSNLSGSLANYSSGGDVSVSNDMFYGAELEYMAAGGTSEIGNQTSVFLGLYLMRILPDALTVMNNKEVELTAAFASIAAPIVYAVFIIAEPLIDVLLLVNGVNVYFFKDFVYLVPSGWSTLLSDFTKATNMPAAAKDNIKELFKDDIGTVYGTTTKTGLFNMDYTEQTMILLMMTVKQDDYLKRLQNLIQMECRKKYGENYRLDKAYTYLYCDVECTLNPMFNLDTLTKNGLFRFHQMEYSGY